MSSHYTVILDACTLYPAQLRDLLLSLAGMGIFRARWTDQIHDEWIDALLREPRGLDRQRLERTRGLMNAAVPDCLVTGYEPLIAGLILPDPDDRHVLAAAIKVGADAIVTTNLRDFPAASLRAFGIEAISPDDFVCSQIDLFTEVALAAIREQRERLRRPPLTREVFLQRLESQVPRTVAMLRTPECFYRI